MIAVLADYQKTSRLAHKHSDCEIPPSWLFFGLIDPCAVPSQPSWSLMRALLSLASYLHSVDTPSNPSRLKCPNNIALTTLRRFIASLVELLETSHQASGGQRDSHAKIWDLRFLRWLLTLWTTNWHGLSELDQLIEKLQVTWPFKTYYVDIFTQTLQSSSSSERSPHDDVAVIEQHLRRTQILLAPLLPPIAPKTAAPPNKSFTKDIRTESLLQFGVPAAEQTAQPVIVLAKPGPRFGSLLVGSTVPR